VLNGGFLEIAARHLGVDARGLWDYREGVDGISFRTPDGYRHRFTFDELENDRSIVGAERCFQGCEATEGHNVLAHKGCWVTHR